MKSVDDKITPKDQGGQAFGIGWRVAGFLGAVCTGVAYSDASITARPNATAYTLWALFFLWIAVRR